MELHLVPPRVILTDVSFMIYTEIVRRFKILSVRSLSTMLGTVPGEELLWTMLSRDFDGSGVFYSVQVELHRLVPALYLVPDNPRSAASAFGLACYELFLRNQAIPKVAYRTLSRQLSGTP